MGPALTVSVLLGMTGQKPLHAAPKEGEGGLVQKPVFVTPSDRHTAGRASLSIAACGKVDEATLASTQAQVGIGLSLLQVLVAVWILIRSRDLTMKPPMTKGSHR